MTVIEFPTWSIRKTVKQRADWIAEIANGYRSAAKKGRKRILAAKSLDKQLFYFGLVSREFHSLIGCVLIELRVLKHEVHDARAYLADVEAVAQSISRTQEIFSSPLPWLALPNKERTQRCMIDLLERFVSELDVLDQALGSLKNGGSRGRQNVGRP